MKPALASRQTGYESFLKSFGAFVTAKIDEKSIPGSEYMIEALKRLEAKVDQFSPSNPEPDHRASAKDFESNVREVYLRGKNGRPLPPSAKSRDVFNWMDGVAMVRLQESNGTASFDSLRSSVLEAFHALTPDEIKARMSDALIRRNADMAVREALDRYQSQKQGH